MQKTNARGLKSRSLAWHPDAVLTHFAAINHLPWAMLLHSGFAEHAHNRFDILVADPQITLQTAGNLTEIGEKNSQYTSSDCPLALLKACLDSLDIAPSADPALPFQGGALGLFGYDLGRRFESLPVIAEQDVSTPDMAIGIYDWALIADHHNQTLTLISWDDVDARLAWLEQQSAPQVTPFMRTSSWATNMNRDEYGAKFRQIQEWLQSGDCYQVNLAQRFQATYQGDEWQAFMRLNAANRAPFSAFLRLPEQAILSLSPERFILLDNNQIQTRPIKGTLPRLSDPHEDALQAQRLAASPKDRAENLMIVDLLRNDIGRVATPGSVKVPELFVVEPFPAVHHLVSTITASLPAHLHATDLLRASFPGGSITGAPKVRAMEIIETLEPHRRNAWCGSIGYISFCGNMDTNITIRTVTAQDGSLYCSAGGGIVADSDEAAEYQETFDKVNRILNYL